MTVKRWKAAADRVLVQQTERPKQTVGGIVLPDKMKNAKVERGTVLAVGPQAEGVRVGDDVFFIASGAFEVERGLWSVNHDYIAAIVREEAVVDDTDYEALERKHLGDPDLKTGIYRE